MPIQFLQELVKYPTVTPQECGIYEHILKKLKPIADNANIKTLKIEQEQNGVKNLFYAFMPNNNSPHTLQHICFAGHIDVVPTGDGWEYEAFSGIEKNGYIYGRGTQDMKGGISAFVCAIRKVLEYPIFIESKCMVSILLTSDEEGEGIYGTNLMLKELETQGLLPQSCIVAEPTSIHSTGDMIKIGRRGSINGTIIIQGKQGHVAYPQKCINPIELLGHKLGELAGIPLDNGDSNFAPSLLVITDIRGGLEATNVTPQNLKLMFNVRNSPLSSEDSIREYISSVLDSIPYELTINVSSLPFITKQDNTLVQTLTKVTKHVANIEAELSTSGGTSDARFFAQYGVNVVEIGVPNDRIHAIDERVSIKDITTLYDIFVEFLHLSIQSAKNN